SGHAQGQRLRDRGLRGETGSRHPRPARAEEVAFPGSTATATSDVRYRPGRRNTRLLSGDHHLAWKLPVVLEEGLLFFQIRRLGMPVAVDVDRARQDGVLTRRGPLPRIGEELPGV